MRRPGSLLPVQSDGRNSYCTPATDGVSYKDITPRWSVAGICWEWSHRAQVVDGQVPLAASIDGIYQDANAAQRTVNSYERLWQDTNGNRVPDCDLLNFANNDECAGPSGPTQTTCATAATRAPRRTWTGDWPGDEAMRTHRSEHSSDVQAYCDRNGDTLLDGLGTAAL